jgi:hypothetical protein
MGILDIRRSHGNPFSPHAHARGDDQHKKDSGCEVLVVAEIRSPFKRS